MDYIKKFMEDNNIGQEEQFYILNEDKILLEGRFIIIDNELRYVTCPAKLNCNKVFMELLQGNYSLVKYGNYFVPDTEPYYTVNNYGGEYNNAIANCDMYKHKVERDYISAQHKLYRLFHKYSMENKLKVNNWVIASTKPKYSIHYNLETNEYEVICSSKTEVVGAVYFDSEKVANDCLRKYKDLIEELAMLRNLYKNLQS